MIVLLLMLQVTFISKFSLIFLDFFFFFFGKGLIYY